MNTIYHYCKGIDLTTINSLKKDVPVSELKKFMKEAKIVYDSLNNFINDLNEFKTLVGSKKTTNEQFFERYVQLYFPIDFESVITNTATQIFGQHPSKAIIRTNILNEKNGKPMDFNILLPNDIELPEGRIFTSEEIHKLIANKSLLVLNKYDTNLPAKLSMCVTEKPNEFIALNEIFKTISNDKQLTKEVVDTHPTLVTLLKNSIKTLTVKKDIDRLNEVKIKSLTNTKKNYEIIKSRSVIITNNNAEKKSSIVTANVSED